MICGHALKLADLVGWVPIDLSAKPESRVVQWIDVGDASFDEPTFRLTVARRLSTPGTRATATGLDALTQLPAIAPHLSPRGFIFHMSRVGSTLLANALRASPSNLVVVEPRPLNQLLVSPFRLSHPDDWGAWMVGLVAALGQPRKPSHEHYFLKFTSHNILQLNLIRHIFPDVPWLFIYRDPVDVMLSNLEWPARWSQIHENPPAGLNIFGIAPERLRAMSQAAFFAEVLRAFCEAALAAGPGRRAFVNYTQLTPQAIAGVADFFGVGEEIKVLPPERLRDVFMVDAKDPGRNSFVADSNAKRERAEPEVLRLCDELLAEPYRHLEEQRLQP
jgi:hypothetical protein